MVSFENLVKNRTTSMGIAMIMVVLYHLFCIDKTVSLWKIFYPGYMGVDTFLFLSGYGLCYSINKNSAVAFIKRRFARVLPTFLLMASMITIISVVGGEKVSSWDWFCNLTTISYYTDWGGQFIDWYLSSLMVLYCLFPVIYKMMAKQGDTQAVLIVVTTLVAVMTIISLADFDWKYECSIARIPIFLAGIVYYKNKSLFVKRIPPAFLVCFLISLVLYKKCFIHTYMVVYMLAPLVLYITSICASIINAKSSLFSKCTDFMGANSLEIYAADVVTMSCFTLINGLEYLSIIYFMLLSAFTVCFVFFNRIIKKRF